MNQTIYFRKDIWELFGSEPKKSDLINSLLEAHYLGEQPIKINLKPADTSIGQSGKIPAALNIPGVQVASEVFKPNAPDPVFGYPCCKLKKPCKHWVWNDIDTAWVNQLTGEARES